MIKGGKSVGNKRAAKISMFVDAIKKDGRWNNDQGLLTHPEEHYHQYWDDLSGRPLDPALVQQARREEMKEFAKHEVYRKVPIKECHDKTGKEPIGTRWVDINKGDEATPEYRSRLVAQELNQEKRDDIFAATPPLEVLRLMLSILASTRARKNGN